METGETLNRDGQNSTLPDTSYIDGNGTLLVTSCIDGRSPLGDSGGNDTLLTTSAWGNSRRVNQSKTPQPGQVGEIIVMLQAYLRICQQPPRSTVAIDSYQARPPQSQEHISSKIARTIFKSPDMILALVEKDPTLDLLVQLVNCLTRSANMTYSMLACFRSQATQTLAKQNGSQAEATASTPAEMPILVLQNGTPWPTRLSIALQQQEGGHKATNGLHPLVDSLARHGLIKTGGNRQANQLMNAINAAKQKEPAWRQVMMSKWCRYNPIVTGPIILVITFIAWLIGRPIKPCIQTSQTGYNGYRHTGPNTPLKYTSAGAVPLQTSTPYGRGNVNGAWLSPPIQGQKLHTFTDTSFT